MALSAGNKVLASDFISLKARVKAEMNRRNLEGSLTGYAAATYDYTVTPTTGGPILVEHINKVIEPMNAIAPTGFDSIQQPGAPVKALDEVEAKLAAHEVYPIYGSGTDCSGGCSGICSTVCVSACTSTCSSCSGCSGGCTSCSGSCSGTCSGCSGTCSSCSGCSGTCSGCSGGCTGTCSGCSGSCSGGCKGSCSSTCTSGCTS